MSVRTDRSVQSNSNPCLLSNAWDKLSIVYVSKFMEIMGKKLNVFLHGLPDIGLLEGTNTSVRGSSMRSCHCCGHHHVDSIYLDPNFNYYIDESE